MAAAVPASTPSVFDLRSAALTLIAVALKSADWSVLADELAAQAADNPNLFDDDPVAIDLGALKASDEPLDFAGLIALLRHYKMVPIAVKGGSPAQMAAAHAAGLVEAPDFVAPSRRPAAPTPVPAPAPEIREVIREVRVEVEAPPAPTLVIDKPLRSGQQVYARGGDVVVLARGQLSAPR